MRKGLKEAITDLTPVLGEINCFLHIRKEASFGLFRNTRIDPTDPPSIAPADMFIEDMFYRYLFLGVLTLSGYGIYETVKYFCN